MVRGPLPGSGRRRSTLRRPILLTGVLAAVVSLVAACTSDGDSGRSTTKPVYGGDLVIGGTQAIQTLNKEIAFTSSDGMRVIENVYDRLYVLDQHATPRPSLAISHTISADQLTWTFALQPDRRFSNGDPITADDVVFSLDLARKGLYVGPIYGKIDEVTAADPHTVVITLSAPDPALLVKLTLFTAGVIPADYAGEKPKDFWDKPVASGPWEINSFTPGRTAKVVPNPQYPGPKPYLDSVTFTLVPDANTRLLQLFNGQTQLISTPSNAQLNSVRANPKSTVLEFPSTEVDFLTLNTARPPLDDVHFRRAVSLAIDRRSIVQSALLGNGEPAASWVSRHVLGGYQPAAGIEYDPEAAKRELAQSATPSGGSLQLDYLGGLSPAFSVAAQIIQQNLKDIGIDVSIRAADNATLSAGIQNKSYGMTFGFASYDIPDPSEDVDFYLTTDGFGSFYNATDVRQLRDDAQLMGGAARIAAYRKVVDALVANADTIGLYSVPWVWGASRDLHGLTQLATGQFSFSKLWLG